ncbi:MAG: DUF814 domain-containing protein [Spirochaetes bacterium]|nr:DUF814 domain-containing protein [Spirochaetota bacterium]
MDISDEYIVLTSYINSFLSGARLDGITEVCDNTFEFVFYLSGQGKRYMFLSFSRNVFRACILNEKGIGTRRPPSSFIMGLRKYLINARISNAIYYKQSRTLLIHFFSKNYSNDFTLALNNKDLMLFGPKKDIVYSSKGSGISFPEKDPFRDLPETTLKQADDIFKKNALLISHEAFTSKKNRLLKPVKKKIKHLRKMLDKIELDRKRFLECDDLQKKGELIKTQFYKLKKGMKSVNLEDYSSQGKEVAITLNPMLTPAENVAGIFKTAKKYRRGLDKIKERVSGIEEELLKFCDLEDSILSSREDDINEFENIVESLGIIKKAVQGIKNKEGTKRSSLPYRIIEKEEFSMYIGKNARGNEYVTFRVASGNDLWFHTHNYPGSHLVLKRKNKAYKYTASDIHEAAVAALYYSTAKKYFREEVIYTEAKNIKSIKGAALGQVSLAAGKTIIVSLEDADVKKALSSRILHT